MNRFNKRYYLKVISLVLPALTLLFMQSCIKNDIPYPNIQLNITDFAVDGMIGRPVISNDDKTITLNVADTANIKNIRVSVFRITDGATASLSANTYIDLSRSHWVTLSLYKDEYWKITATQEIERSFRIENQVGTASFDAENKVAYANILKPEDVFTPNIKISLTELKLGPTGSTINNIRTTTPDVTWKWENNNWHTTVMVDYKYFDEPQEWTLFIFPTTSVVNTVSADAWVNIAYLHGEGQEGAAHGFEIREQYTEEWTTVNPASIVSERGSFSARVSGLKAETSYVFRAVSGEDKGPELTFTTGVAVPLTNASFDRWHKVGKVWNPWSENETPFWDSGNDGATTLGESNTQPSEDLAPGAPAGSYSAKLESKFVGIGTIGKFAAGNLFVGEFKRVDGTNGVLDFGKPFTARPTKLKGYYKYTTAPINYASTEYVDLKGKNDTCCIYIALGDWDECVEIRTNPKNPKYFDKDDPNIIAYAEFTSGQSVTQYTPFELKLDYRSTSRVPKYIIVVCSASKYGDFFTGGAGSVLYVDEFSLEYDD